MLSFCKGFGIGGSTVVTGVSVADSDAKSSGGGKFCGNCGAKNQTSKFCGECGMCLLEEQTNRYHVLLWD